jgi:hypothetical protein
MAVKKPAKVTRKVTPETLEALGAARLAAILAGVAETRPDLKRRLRMELAAESGAGPLAAEIDRRLVSFETSRGHIGWRQRPAFLRDLDALRMLISERLAGLDVFAAVERLWRLLDAAPQLNRRLRGRDAQLVQLFERAAADLGGLVQALDPGAAVDRLVEALERNPSGWAAWLPAFLDACPEAIAEQALRLMLVQPGAAPGRATLVRQLADAAGEVDAYLATWSGPALAMPSVAAGAAHRLLAAGRIEAAGDILRAAAPAPSRRGGPAEPPDTDWESAWIDYLERAGRTDEAQAARWSSFERTLSVERARAFIARLADFDDVEAETRAFAVAAGHHPFERGLGFLMAWPALAEAARMIERRADEIQISPDAAESWAAKLRRRHPKAAQLLLRGAAAAAFRRREFKTCDRLTEEADSISP